MPRIDLDRDSKHHRREHLFENILWSALYLALFVALLGLFGSSPGSRTEESFSHGKLSYDKYLRRGASSTIDLQIEADEKNEVSVWVENSLLDTVEVESILPQPDHHEIGRGGIRFYFKTLGPTDTSLIRIRVNPENTGWLEGAVQVNAGPKISVRQFAYP